MKRIAFYGSSLLSSYWNGAATYYRGILKAMARLGYDITFYEPDAFDRQAHRDIDPPDWANVVVYQPDLDGLSSVLAEALEADIVIKASGVGVFDDELLLGILRHAAPGALKLFWDVDAPATLAEIDQAPDHLLRQCLPLIDGVLTYGGGAAVIRAYEGVGARLCVPVYNALDPETHHPVEPDGRFTADLAFLGNRLPDREARVDSFFFQPARMMPNRRFLLGGSGWQPEKLPENVHHAGHVGTSDHNAFNVTPLAVLNIAREAMAATGFSPATRVFEAAGAGGCLITDYWQGVDQFLQPDEEVIVARSGREVADILGQLTPERARAIGAAARKRVLLQHTYDNRAKLLNAKLEELSLERFSAKAIGGTA